MPYEESQLAFLGDQKADFYKQALEESAAFREDYQGRKGIIKSTEMFWEDSPDGKIKQNL